MWKSLRTTNSIENLNREFRRRTKTQASFSTEQAAVTLLYGLVAFGQIEFRKICGYKDLGKLDQGRRQVRSVTSYDPLATIEPHQPVARSVR